MRQGFPYAWVLRVPRATLYASCDRARRARGELTTQALALQPLAVERICTAVQLLISCWTASPAILSKKGSMAACSINTFYYSADGAEESERLSVALDLPTLLADQTITPHTLVFSEDDAFGVHDGWTTWADCCATFGFALPSDAPSSVPRGPCASLVYSTDGESQSAEISAAEGRELASAGVIVDDTLIFSEKPGFPFETWTRWADCHQCFAPTAPSEATGAVSRTTSSTHATCSTLYYA